MQKLFDLRTAVPDDYEKLKKLWLSCFDDSPESVENFFQKTVTPENVVVTFDGEKAVGAAYLLESEIKVGGEKYDAFYIYAVCTEKKYRGMGIMRNTLAFCEKTARERNISYLFLVPANGELFKMYEKIGFKVGFTYNEEIIGKTDFSLKNDVGVGLTYRQYAEWRAGFTDDTALATLKETAFDGFYSPVGDSVVCLCNAAGYAVYESENGTVTVHELFGDKNALIGAVIEHSGKDELILRKPTANGGGVPFGMYRALGNVPKIENAFFGIPYGV